MDNFSLNTDSLIFIDSRVDEYQKIVDRNIENTEIVILDSSNDDLETVTEIIEKYENIKSIHLISHGNTGSLELGKTELNNSNIEKYNTQLKSWSNYLRDDGDILIYGCHVGSGEKGREFIQKISNLTNADIAASDDLTGSKAKIGDWDLEITTGNIETDIVIDSSIRTNYKFVLESYRGNEYLVTESTLTRAEAEAEAQRLGGYLVSINDSIEQQWLQETFGNSAPFWIGLSDRNMEGEFVWDNREKLTYTNWAIDQPSNSGLGEDFVAFQRNGKWNDVPGNMKFKAIIEIGNNNPNQIFTYNGKEYRLTSNRQKWFQAKREANNLGGNLVTINNLAEQQWIEDTFLDRQRLWIGLNDRSDESQFTWENGESSNYRNWENGQPNNFGTQGQDFVGLQQNGKWNDYGKFTKLRGIVEIDPSTQFSLERESITINEGEVSVRVKVNRLGNTRGVSSIDYQTTSQTAIELEDFVPVVGTLTFGDGQESMTITIPIINDSQVEIDETFAISLNNPVNATLGTQRTTVVIDDNDSVVESGTLTFTQPMFMVSENVGTARIPVARVGGSRGRVRVEYTTSNDNAIRGQDYNSRSGTLTFNEGETEKFIDVPIIDDRSDEGRENFFITLNNPDGGATIGTESIIVAINDNDRESVITPNPTTGFRYIRLVANSEVRGRPWTTLAELNILDRNGNPIDQSDWTLVSVDSEEIVAEFAPGTNAFDGDPNTFWHTQYRGEDPPHDHTIIIDLGSSYDISGFQYLPRQDKSNGRIEDYTFYVSNDGNNWGSPITSGTFTNTTTEQTVSFIEPGLVGYWKFDEISSSNPIQDFSGNGNNGTSINMYDGNNRNIDGTSGAYNGAPIFDRFNPRSWNFDGLNDYVNIPSNPNLDLSGGQFTQSVWINSEITDNGYHGILGKQIGNGDRRRSPSIWVYDRTKIHTGFSDGDNWNSFITGDVLKPSGWNHIVTTFNNTTYKVYVNGEEVYSTNQFAGKQPLPINSLEIGRVGNTYFEGQIDDVRIYDRTLSNREIRNLYQEQPSVSQVGSWGETIDFPNIPVSAALLPNSTIVTWSSWDRFEFTPSRFARSYTSLYNLNTGLVTEELITQTNHDMFCPGTVMLPDGRLLVNGGGGDTKFTSIYDFNTNEWTVVDSMEYGRWYNVSVTLGDGSVFTLGGNRSTNRQAPGELWNPNTGWTTLEGLPIAPITNSGDRGDEHPQMFLAPNGEIFIAAPSPTMYWYNLEGNGSYREAGIRGDDPYSQNGLSVMYDVGKILRVGGQSLYSGGIVTDVAYDIDINNPNNVTVTKQDSMSYKRSFATGVVMPNGEVFVVGGSEDGVTFNDDRAVYRPEIWNPETGDWTLLEQQSVPRTYHSVALLQPDGRIFVGGGGLCGDCAYNHSNAQIYTPPYLYNEDGTLAERPIITNSPEQLEYGDNFSVSIDNNMSITEFNLVRMSSVTHSVNTDQRFIPVDFTRNNNRYSLSTPDDPNIAPPGYYMLFAINDRGVPSEAQIIQIQ